MSSAAVSSTFKRIKLLELAVEERDAHIASLCMGLSSITSVLDAVSGFSCFGEIERAHMQTVVASSKGLLATVNEARRAMVTP